MINVVAINGVDNMGTVNVVSCDHNGIIHYDTGGNSNVLNYIAHGDLKKINFLFDHRESQQINNKILNETSVFVNQISDPDSHGVSLSKAIGLYQMTKKNTPWINNPEKIMNTGRDTIFNLLNGEPGLITPKTIRVNKFDARDLDQKIKSENMRFPILIRPIGSHGGSDLEYIESETDIEKTSLFDNRDVYISEFHDYKDSNGIYKKYRLVVVAGNVFIRHAIYSDQWKIHSSSRKFMNENEEFCRLEEEELLNFHSQTAPAIKSMIDTIYNKIGLDYFGIDCAIEGGKLVIFEVNANMNILINNQKKPNIWDEYIGKITNEVVSLIVKKHQNV